MIAKKRMKFQVNALANDIIGLTSNSIVFVYIYYATTEPSGIDCVNKISLYFILSFDTFKPNISQAVEGVGRLN